MSAFEMEFELTGLKIKIKGEQGQAPEALQSVQQHIGTLLQSAAGLGTGGGDQKQAHVAPNRFNDGKTIDGNSHINTPNFGKSKLQARKRGVSPGTATPLDFSHDAAQYGSPRQTWNTAQKAMWLLFVVEKQTTQKELSTATLAATFNKFFKEFGPITTTNVTRDLGRARVKHGYVSSDASKEPQTWYLLDDGKKEVDRLIQDVRSKSGS